MELPDGGLADSASDCDPNWNWPWLKALNISPRSWSLRHPEFPDHGCGAALLGLFRHCRAAFFIRNAVTQNYPDQMTEAIRNYADRLVMLIPVAFRCFARYKIDDSAEFGSGFPLLSRLKTLPMQTAVSFPLSKLIPPPSKWPLLTDPRDELAVMAGRTWDSDSPLQTLRWRLRKMDRSDMHI